MHGRSFLWFLVTIFLLGTASVHAETLVCDNGLATVDSHDPKHLPKMCTATDRALAVLDRCALQHPSHVQISVAELENKSCLGLFHCGEGRVEVLSPEEMALRRKDTGLFQHIPPERMFESVIVHEFAHAAMDQTPCPFDACAATSEYFAYSIQLLDFSDEELAPLEETTAEMPTVGYDEINLFIYFMAPSKFVEKVWAHVKERDSICAQLRRVQDGIVLFDKFHP